MWYCYLYNFFPCSFHITLVVEELVVEVISFDVRWSSLIIFLFLLNHEELCWLEIGDFLIEMLLCSLSLWCIVLKIPVVIHGFFSSWRKAFLAILFTKQIENIVSSKLYEVKQQIGSAATLCAQLKAVFMDTSWIEILHVNADFYLTLLRGWTVFPR